MLTKIELIEKQAIINKESKDLLKNMHLKIHHQKKGLQINYHRL